MRWNSFFIVLETKAFFPDYATAFYITIVSYLSVPHYHYVVTNSSITTNSHITTYSASIAYPDISTDR